MYRNISLFLILFLFLSPLTATAQEPAAESLLVWCFEKGDSSACRVLERYFEELSEVGKKCYEENDPAVCEQLTEFGVTEATVQKAKDRALAKAETVRKAEVEASGASDPELSNSAVAVYPRDIAELRMHVSEGKFTLAGTADLGWFHFVGHFDTVTTADMSLGVNIGRSALRISPLVSFLQIGGSEDGVKGIGFGGLARIRPAGSPLRIEGFGRYSFLKGEVGSVLQWDTSANWMFRTGIGDLLVGGELGTSQFIFFGEGESTSPTHIAGTLEWHLPMFAELAFFAKFGPNIAGEFEGNSLFYQAGLFFQVTERFLGRIANRSGKK